MRFAMRAASPRSIYRIAFIGDGKVLQESVGDEATYAMRGKSRYVRARITDSNGKTAWTQPIFRSRSR
ncbi:MAG TPA: hypothetical protein VJZ00_09170 [Thermoanaerobaculia bacterium]|nr:hypothetical protein [Thermoanaerobaculia bacterium]